MNRDVGVNRDETEKYFKEDLILCAIKFELLYHFKV